MRIQTANTKLTITAIICACAALFCAGNAAAGLIQLSLDPEKHTNVKPRTRMYVGDRIEIQPHGPGGGDTPPPALEVWAWDSAVQCGSTRIGFPNQEHVTGNRQQFLYPRYDRGREMWLPINCEVKRAGRSSGMSVQWAASRNRNPAWSVLTVYDRRGALVGQQTFTGEKVYASGPVGRPPNVVTITYADSLHLGTKDKKAPGLITGAGIAPWKIATTIQCSGEACAFLTIDGVVGRHDLNHGWRGIISHVADTITIEAAGTPPGKPRTGEINVALEIL